MVFNAWMTRFLLFDETDTMLCALPLFHVFASYPMLLASVASGAHFVMLTPQGFRGEGVIDNFYKLIERHRATFLCAVPTAISALDQRAVNADVSSLRYLISGSAPLPQALFRRFEENTGVRILEGYGMTEATCVTACNPPFGERKIGSVGLPLPYMHVRICVFDGDGGWIRDCGTDEVGEICFKGPSVFPGFQGPEAERGPVLRSRRGRRGLAAHRRSRPPRRRRLYLDHRPGQGPDHPRRSQHRSGPDRGGAGQTPVRAFVGAIGQPDAYAGEMPCAYVELKEGAACDAEELQRFAADHVAERAARPALVTVMPELPKTAVGKIFKPALRKEAIGRIFSQALAEAGVAADVDVVEDKKLGLVAIVHPHGGEVDEAALDRILNRFARPWRWRAVSNVDVGAGWKGRRTGRRPPPARRPRARSDRRWRCRSGSPKARRRRRETR